MSAAFKKIKDYTQDELNEAIKNADQHCHLCKVNFYMILNGVDAYLERRRRKEELEEAARLEKADMDYFGPKD